MSIVYTYTQWEKKKTHLIHFSFEFAKHVITFGDSCLKVTVLFFVGFNLQKQEEIRNRIFSFAVYWTILVVYILISSDIQNNLLK